MGKSADEVGEVEFHNSDAVSETRWTFFRVFLFLFFTLPSKDPVCICGLCL